MLARSAEAAALMRERLIEPDVAVSKAGEPPTGWHGRFQARVWEKLAFLL